MNPDNFGKNLKDILEYLEISQVEFAKKTGMTPAAISQLINGMREPSLSTICKILCALPVKFEKLVGVRK